MRTDEDMLIVITHYPPFNERQEPSEVTDMLEAYRVNQVIYGHLHGYYQRNAFNGVLTVSYTHLDVYKRQALL